MTAELVQKREGWEKEEGAKKDKRSPFFPSQRLGTCVVSLSLDQLVASGHSSERVDESQSGQEPQIGDHGFCPLPKRYLNSCE